MIRTIAFFNLNIIGHIRHSLPIIEKLHRKSKDYSYIIIYDEYDPLLYHNLSNRLPSSAQLVFAGSPSYKKISEKLRYYKVDYLLVCAQRISDSAYVSAARSLGIQTGMMQHGMYIPFMKREPKLFVKNFIKTSRYARYALAIADASHNDRLQYFRDYIKIFIFGENIHNTQIDRKLVNVDTVFVYGEYWKQYHTEQFGYSRDSQFLVGTPDLTQLSLIQKSPQEDAICYIAQSLVEDGRIDREIMINFLDLLQRETSSRKLYIKLHPRSDLSLYEKMRDKENIIFCNQLLPNCTAYIGHYSTLIVLAGAITKNILLWEFKGHEIPLYFANIAKLITSDSDSLKRFIDAEDCERLFSGHNDFHEYFYHDDIDPFEKVAHYISTSI